MADHKKQALRVDITRALSTVRARAKAERESRVAGASRTLSVDELAGDYDFARLLVTTLDGKSRPITQKDLDVFRRNAAALGRKFKGGITARQVIDTTIPAIRARSNAQIHTAAPIKLVGSDLQVVTNAGPDSGHSRHFVTFGLLNMPAAVASPKRPIDMARFVSGGPITLECDCEDFRFRLRYIATIGKFVHGRPEPAYPRFTNPRLVYACGCKHVLRACHNLDSGLFRGFIATAIDRQRKTLNERTAVIASKRDTREHDDRAARSAKVIRTTEERIVNAAKRGGKVVAAVTAAAEKLAKKQAAKAKRSAAGALKATEQTMQKLLAQRAITPEAYAQVMKALKSSEVKG